MRTQTIHMHLTYVEGGGRDLENKNRIQNNNNNNNDDEKKKYRRKRAQVGGRGGMLLPSLHVSRRGSGDPDQACDRLLVDTSLIACAREREEERESRRS